MPKTSFDNQITVLRTHRPARTVGALLLAAAATGCGGGGGSTPPTFVTEALDATGVTTTTGTEQPTTTTTTSTEQTPATATSDSVTPLTGEQLAANYLSAVRDLGFNAFLNGSSGGIPPGFAATSVPSSGTATYVGGSALTVDDDRPNNSFLSTARLEVDFATEAVTGALTNTVEATIVDGAVTDSQPLTGTLSISNGRWAQVDSNSFRVSPTGDLPGFEADVDGTLVGDGESLVFDLTMGGVFETGADGIAAGLNGTVSASDVGSATPPTDFNAIGALFAPRQ